MPKFNSYHVTLMFSKHAQEECIHLNQRELVRLCV